MKTILQITPQGVKCVDSYGDAAVKTPEIMLRTFVDWEFDLRSESRRESGELAKYVPSGNGITNWYFALDRDYDKQTVPKILITEGITFQSDNEFSTLKVVIPDTGTAELVSDMEGLASRKYTAEIGALDENARAVAIWQFPVAVKNRIFDMGETAVPPHVTTPDYYTAFEINSMLAAKANVIDVYTKQEIDTMIGGVETQLSEI